MQKESKLLSQLQSMHICGRAGRAHGLFLCLIHHPVPHSSPGLVLFSRMVKTRQKFLRTNVSKKNFLALIKNGLDALKRQSMALEMCNEFLSSIFSFYGYAARF